MESLGTPPSMVGNDSSAEPFRQRRRLVLLTAAGAALTSLGGVVGATFIKSPEQLRAEAQPPGRSLLTATVDRRVLASTVVARGQVEAAHAIEATPAAVQGAAVSVVTAVLKKAGDTVNAGDVPLSVSGRPLVVLQGEIPAYRDMRPSDEGLDIAQLQQAMRQIGVYHGGDSAGRFGAATKVAVERLYAKVGFAVPNTGGPGGKADRAALRAAEDAVTSAAHAVAALQAQISAGQPITPAAGQPSLAQQLEQAERTLARAQRDRSDLVASTGPMVPLSEVVFLPALPATVTKLTAKVGSVVTAPLITFAAGVLVVAVKLPPDQGGLVKVGMPVELTSESLGQKATGVVSTVGPVTADTAQGGGPPHIPVLVTPSTVLSNQWNTMDVRVTIIAARTSAEVIVVPLAAVSAGADGKTTVTVRRSDGALAAVEVRAGISADGFVEVTAVTGALQAGDQVVVGR